MRKRGAAARHETYLQTLDEFRLLLVYYTEAEVDLVGLVEIGLDLHDLRECLLCVVIAAIAIVENTDSIPEHRVLRQVSVRPVMKSGCDRRTLASLRFTSACW